MTRKEDSLVPDHPLVGRRVLHKHRQSCDYNEDHRKSYHGNVTAVYRGCNGLVRVKYDGRDYDCVGSSLDLVLAEIWPGPNSELKTEETRSDSFVLIQWGYFGGLLGFRGNGSETIHGSYRRYTQVATERGLLHVDLASNRYFHVDLIPEYPWIPTQGCACVWCQPHHEKCYCGACRRKNSAKPKFDRLLKQNPKETT